MKISKILLAGVAAAFLSASAQAADITANSSGWINSAGGSNSGGSFGNGIDNTFTGFEGDAFANWFEFVLPASAITDATINIYNQAANTTIDPDAVYSLYGATGFSFSGLTSGPVFGSITLGEADTGVGHFVSIALNAAGVSFLNANLGGSVVLSGLTTTTFDTSSCYDCIAAFGYSDGTPAATLSVNSGGGVPEPATWALMIGGFGLAGATLRRRRVVLARAA